jgi:hypothetical protein
LGWRDIGTIHGHISDFLGRTPQSLRREQNE